MRIEESCGAVVFTRVEGEVCYVLVCSLEGFYGYPKGHREAGETPEETAMREIWEEVGLRVTLLPGFCTQDEHLIPQKPDTIKRITYFLAEYSDQPVTLQKEELLGAELCAFDKALALFQFESSRRILREAHTFLLKTKI